MKTFIEYCSENGMPLFDEKTTRTGIMNWAYPDGYIRSHYSALYFTPVAADAIQKMGDKSDEDNVDHGEMSWKGHAKTKK
jgi:hypothetical protein